MINQSLYADDDKNAVRFSAITKFEDEIRFSGFAAKFVLTGTEIYHIKGRKYSVKHGEYIVGNSGTISSIKIHGDEVVKGLCIDVSEKIIGEVADYTFKNVEGLNDFLLGDQFLVNKYNAQKTNLGYALSEIARRITDGSLDQSLLGMELFYSIAESIITDQSIIFNEFSRLNHRKPETNQHLYLQLLQAKEFMDENLASDLNLELLAGKSFISMYHFIRLFKTTFNLSPYQYILRKRLEWSRKLLSEGHSVQNTATTVGFTDTPTFSKAFKKIYGVSPVTLIPK